MHNYMPYAGATQRKFLEDFDLLPREVKELLWDHPVMPDFDDLKDAWSLVEKDPRFKDIFMRLNINAALRKLEVKRLADLNREQRANAKRNKWHDKWRQRHEKTRVAAVYQVYTVDPKQARLVQRVTEEEAAKLLTSRKEAKDVQPATVRVFQGYKRLPPEKVEELKASKEEFQMPKPVSIIKAFGNAGGNNA
jgi:hypothetical protein